MKIVIVADNIRSIENTGALYRISDGIGAEEIILVGITPYPDLGEKDTRRPWLKERMTHRLRKTGLDGMHIESLYFEDRMDAINYLKQNNYMLVCLEQTAKSIDYKKLSEFLEMNNLKSNLVAIIAGNEVEGVHKEFLDVADVCVEIPMRGNGKSLNVAVATGILSFALV